MSHITTDVMQECQKMLTEFPVLIPSPSQAMEPLVLVQKILDCMHDIKDRRDTL